MSTPDDTLEVEIEQLVYRGRGLARHEGRVVFVPGVAPGERVVARVTRAHRAWLEARAERVLSASPDRIDPGCPLALAAGGDPAACCPGCVYRHLRYSAEVAAKQAQLRHFLAHALRTAEPPLAAPAPAPAADGYRSRITLHRDPRQPGRTGYVGADNRTLLDVPDCPLAAAPIRAALPAIRNAPWSGGRSLTVCETPADGVVSWCRAARNGRPWLTEPSPLGPLQVPRGSFTQVNRAVASGLVEAVRTWLAAWPPHTVIDAYGGIGLFALAAAAAGHRAAGCDSDPVAIEAARHNARALGLPDITFHAAPTEVVLPRLLRDQPAESLTVLVDPPRAGLSPVVRRTLAGARPARLVYVSCAADTLARDLRELATAGYRLEQAQLFDMFPRTPYFETLAVLRRDTPA